MWDFLNGSLVWGAAAAAAPVVLHLVMRRKPKHLEFPPLRFIARRHEVNRRQLRLRHLILLALRMALVALGALALSGPTLRTGDSGDVGGEAGEPVAAALVFDTSVHMEYRHENRTRLAAAQETGEWLIARLPPESKVAVFDSRGGSAAFQSDFGSAKRRVRTLQTAARGQPLPQVMAEARRLLAGSPLARKEMYVFTDLTQAAWPRETRAGLQKQSVESPGVGVTLIDVGVDRPVNFGLGPVELEGASHLAGEVLSSRSSLGVRTGLSAMNSGGKRTVELYLLEPDPADATKRIARKSGERTVLLKPDATQPVEFSVAALSAGTHQGYVQILGEDGLAADDRRFFTVEVKPAWRVLIVAPKPADEYALFLAQALAPEPLRREGRAPFECTTVAQDELGTLSYAPFSAIGLLDPKPLEREAWDKLGDFVAAGHGLAVFLGRNADGQAVGSFNQGPAQDLLAGKLLRQAVSRDNSRYLSPQDWQHPIFAPLRRHEGSIPWFLHPVYRYWQLGDPPAGVHVVARYNDEGPAILERPLGKGRVITMTTPVSDDLSRDPWNRFTAIDAWPFPPLANCMFLYLVGTADQTLNYLAGQTASLQLNPSDTYESYVLGMPDGTEVRVAPDLTQHVLVVAATDEPGNYRVGAGGAEGVDRGFSVNVAAEQTRLDRISAEELAELGRLIPCRVARNRDEIEVDWGPGGGIWDFFPALIFAVALVLGVEHVVANRFYRNGKG